MRDHFIEQACLTVMLFICTPGTIDDVNTYILLQGTWCLKTVSWKSPRADALLASRLLHDLLFCGSFASPALHFKLLDANQSKKKMTNNISCTVHFTHLSAISLILSVPGAISRTQKECRTLYMESLVIRTRLLRVIGSYFLAQGVWINTSLWVIATFLFQQQRWKTTKQMFIHHEDCHVRIVSIRLRGNLLG